MIQDSAWIPAIIGIITLFFWLPGFFIARLFHLPTKGLLGITLSLFLGFSIMPYLFQISFMLIGFTPNSTWFSWFAVLVFLGIFLSFGKSMPTFSVPIFLSRTIATISLLLISLVMLLFLYAYPMVKDLSGIWHTVVITDSDKHYMVVTSLLTSKKFPPIVSYSHLSADTPLRYY